MCPNGTWHYQRDKTYFSPSLGLQGSGGLDVADPASFHHLQCGGGVWLQQADNGDKIHSKNKQLVETMQQPHNPECINVQQLMASLRRQRLFATVSRKRRSAAFKMNQTFSGSLISSDCVFERHSREIIFKAAGA